MNLTKQQLLDILEDDSFSIKHNSSEKLRYVMQQLEKEMSNEEKQYIISNDWSRRPTNNALTDISQLSEVIVIKAREYHKLLLIEDEEVAKEPKYVKLRESKRRRGGKGRHRNLYK